MIDKTRIATRVPAAVLAAAIVGMAPADSGVTAVPEGLTSGEWASIRAAYDAGRHAVVPADDGHRARNPGQQWTTGFDGRGFLVQPDGGEWTWGLELESYGFAGAEGAVVGAPSARVDGARLSYVWDATLTEWYVNDGRGLEHGYTVNARPANAAGPLRLTLSVRGELNADVEIDGKDVRFVDGNGTTVLNYAGLTVFDADGAKVPARFEEVADGLLLTVDEAGARYPLTIDPIAQQAYLKASNTDAGDQFGIGVAVSGDTVVVGARFEDSAATGVNGNQADNSAGGAGAAYVFVRNGTTWTQQAYLKASNTDAGDSFGVSVAISGDTVVVGARNDDSSATGVDGDQADDSFTDAGAAYVFVRSGTTWTQQAYLKASNTESGDFFGRTVAVSGDTVVIGAPGEDSNATGVNGDQSNNSLLEAGAAYVFVRTGIAWSQQAYLKASNTDQDDWFGHSVALSGDTVVVGARFEDSNSTGVNGNQTDNSASSAGAAYVFERSGTTWSQQGYLKASNSGQGDEFGLSVAASGDTVAIGAFLEDSTATGVNGDQTDNSMLNPGAAYVFVRSGSNWSQEAYLKAPSNGVNDQFGYSVAASGDTVVVGAHAEDSNATGVNGNPNNDSAGNSGAACVFKRCGTTWSQQAYLKASNTGINDLFGTSVAVSADTVVVGAIQEDSNATGVNGNQADNGFGDSGAAYVFTLAPANLVVNGNFEGPGLVGVDSDYVHTPNGNSAEGTWWVHPWDPGEPWFATQHTPDGFGAMSANGDNSMDAGQKRVWFQSVCVAAGMTYRYSAWALGTVEGVTGYSLRLAVDGVPIGAVASPTAANTWEELTTTFVATGPIVELAIVNVSGITFPNDFMLDDISLELVASASDFDGNGAVNAADLAFLLGAWGPCGACTNCPWERRTFPSCSERGPDETSDRRH
jgi:drug/metabolite transporter superfamily protein YnfA